MQNFMAIGQTVPEIWRFFNFFSKWRWSAILDRLSMYGPLQRVFGGLYHCTKFCWNRSSSFDNMQILIFNEFGLKMPIHAPKMEVLGDYTP